MTLRKLKLPTPKDRASAVFWGILLSGLEPREVELIVDGHGDLLPKERREKAAKHWARLEGKWVERADGE